MRFVALHILLILGVKVLCVIVVIQVQVVCLICPPSALGLWVYILGECMALWGESNEPSIQHQVCIFRQCVDS